MYFQRAQIRKLSLCKDWSDQRSGMLPELSIHFENSPPHKVSSDIRSQRSKAVVLKVAGEDSLDILRLARLNACDTQRICLIGVSTQLCPSATLFKELMILCSFFYLSYEEVKSEHWIPMRIHLGLQTALTQRGPTVREGSKQSVESA